jgi:hypothetical protein
MSRATPDQIIAHVDLLRAVDRLLTQAEVVRQKRDALERLLPSDQAAGHASTAVGKAEGQRHG